VSWRVLVEYHASLVSLSLWQARRAVIDEVTRVLARRPPAARRRPLAEACGLVLGEPLLADRDQPPFDRSTRDGFAVCAGDLREAVTAPVLLRLIGEVAAGATFAGRVTPGSCVEIMTGAPVPAGADAVVMVEHVERQPDAGPGGGVGIKVSRSLRPGENVVARGSELPRGALALASGQLIDPAAVGLLASLGAAQPLLGPPPRVAVLATGDELVPVEAAPGPDQIRDSNRHTLAAQIARAGAQTVSSAAVGDDPAQLQAALAAAGAAGDLVLVSGGVSMGKYDHVEGALARLGARVVFDGVDIRPGKPLVFGFLGDKPFFGLPGNPLSTFVTFELFVRPALALLAGGVARAELSLQGAVLQQAYAQRKLGLTVFVPARLAPAADQAVPQVTGVTPLVSQGSGDLVSLAAADVFMVVAPGVEAIAAGQVVPLLPK
jgi:molybdopterin molybdotransferase